MKKQNSTGKLIISEPPVHALSTVVTLVLDYVWMLPETGVSVLSSPRITVMGELILMSVLGIVCFFTVFSVQTLVARDPFGPGFVKALVMSIIAAIPYAVVTTLVGPVLLGWVGLYYGEGLLRKLLSQN